MTALGFFLGITYLMVGLLALLWFTDRFGSRLSRQLEDSLPLQMTAMALWPLTLAIDAALLLVRRRNRRCWP